METLNSIIERDPIDYSTRYRFNPVQDGHCQMSRKGQVVLHRRLVNMVLGINFPKTILSVVEKIEEDGHFCGLVLKPITEPQPDRITIYRYKFGGMLVLNNLFYKLDLNYKHDQFSFISEPVNLEDGSMGIRLLVTDRKPWPEYLYPQISEQESILKENPSSFDHLVDSLPPTVKLSHEQQRSDEEQFRALFATFLDWKISQQNQIDSFEFKRNFADFSQNLNQILFHIALPDNLSGLITSLPE